jgi:hypothetical protein
MLQIKDLGNVGTSRQGRDLRSVTAVELRSERPKRVRMSRGKKVELGLGEKLRVRGWRLYITSKITIEE